MEDLLPPAKSSAPLSVATKLVAIEAGRQWDLEASFSLLGQSSSQLSGAGWFASLLAPAVVALSQLAALK